jgi:hypothetical protein
MTIDTQVETVRTARLSVSEFEFGLLVRALGELKTRSEAHGFRGTAHACSDLTAELNAQRRLTTTATVQP